MSEVVFGPYFNKGASARNVGELVSLGLNFEFATANQSATAPVYHLSKADYNFGLGNYYVPADCISWRVVYRPYFAKQIHGVLFLPLDEVVSSLYRSFKHARSLVQALTEFREHLPDRVSGKKARFDSKALLSPQVFAAGVRIAEYFPYGRTLHVSFKWVPSQDSDRLESPIETHLGILEFLGLADGTLSRGKWRKPPSDSLSQTLRTDLRHLLKVSPISLFSQEGAKFTFDQFRWQPVHLMTPKQLKAARIKFIREHRELWGDHKALAKALQDAELYQKETDLYHIRRSIPKLVHEADTKQ